MIFISTGGERRRSAAEVAESLYLNGINAVELSGGACSESLRSELIALSKKMTLQVHNYFPPPLNPFVFNLASSNQDIFKKSYQHVLDALKLAVELNRPVYSFHAGFRMNPKVSELGNSINRYDLTDYKWAVKRFEEIVLNLAEIARREGVQLLIENNVINAVNMTTFGDDPFLLTHPDSIEDFMKNMPSNVRLLMDVAHLKVSSKALDFDLIKGHQQLKPWISGYHLSDNDGNADSNQRVEHSSWFWSDLKRGLDYYSLEVYGLGVEELLEQYEMAKTLV